MWKEGVITENKLKHFTITVDKEEKVYAAKNSPIIAPYRTHTVHSIQSVLTPENKLKLVKEFKPLTNLGNT
jgi:hypothetical protein